MKRIVARILLLGMILSLFSCSGELVSPSTTAWETAPTVSQTAESQTEAPPKTEVTGSVFLGMAEPIPLLSVSPEASSQQLKDALSWEDICSFPVKRSDMTVEEMRTLCVEFFRYAKTAAWICDANLSFRRAKASNTPDQMSAETVYGGLPYVGLGSGNIYRLLDYMNPETGVVDLSEAVNIEDTSSNLDVVSETMKLFGNQCSIGAYWGWGRVINSARYEWTSGMVLSRGFIRVGSYSYAPFGDAITSFSTERTTTKILAANGQQKMFESYALLQPADGLVYYTTAGHVIMCSSTPVVVRNADGTINGDKSYITIIDQAATWKTATNAAGDTYTYKSGVDEKKTFSSLYKGSYLPFTFKEFLGLDPVEATVCEFNQTGESITVSQLSRGMVTANYGISDAYAILRDASGTVLKIGAARATTANARSLTLVKAIQEDEWKEFAGKGYTVEIVAQLSTGERPILYRAALIDG